MTLHSDAQGIDRGSGDQQTRAVLSVLGRDRKGIVASISGVLYQSDANIDDIQQTILINMFSMTMLISINEASCAFDTLSERLDKVSTELGVQIVLQRQDLFDFMYKV
ncbi:MAG: ACT domain-containing protein [Coriobacteriales bacterium]|nr:ACT domain-containing protein [Coriobacteriales bacterium]